MEEMKMQDIVTIAAGEARAEALLEAIAVVLSEAWPRVSVLRKLLGVPVPEEEKKEVNE